jgi:hypothetical protein
MFEKAQQRAEQEVQIGKRSLLRMVLFGTVAYALTPEGQDIIHAMELGPKTIGVLAMIAGAIRSQIPAPPAK